MSRTERVTPRLLRRWGLPEPGDSKNSRGRAIVVGGSASSPGAVRLAGESALRVGAGKVGLLVPTDVVDALGASVPEAGIFALPPNGAPDEAASDEWGSADAVLVGPGFVDPDTSRRWLYAAAERTDGCLVVDAFALGVLPQLDRAMLPEHLILTPNPTESEILLDDDTSGDLVADVARIAERFSATVSCQGVVAAPDGRIWRLDDGGPGLGTAGSGDVLSGAVVGFAARGLPPEQAAVWGTWAHARAGDRLTGRLGLGFLARELSTELAAAVAEVAGTDADA